jgi:ADP-ribosylglycohydrolase
MTALFPATGEVPVAGRQLRQGGCVTENQLIDRAIGALSAAAVGDALGGATEGWEASEILEHFGAPVEGTVASIRRTKGIDRPLSPFHKGDGHITDDTLMTRALVKIYAEKRDHLDAFDIESRLVPHLIEDKVWIPELGREDLLYHRLFLAEKWLVAKLKYGHADPREGGVGNIVNCGAAMYIAPVGLANAGDPSGAYAEAVEISGAHQSSYGREAAAVLAAGIAEAVRPGATVASVVDVCMLLAHDGTRAAIEAVASAASELGSWRDGGLAQLRDAFAPFDSVGVPYAQPGLGARIPSRLHSIEELPLALGLLVATGGDCSETILGGVNYGRDSDSIASMGGALAGALGGTSSVRGDWVEEVGSASRYDLEEPGRTMADVAVAILARDVERQARRLDAMDVLTTEAPQVPV